MVLHVGRNFGILSQHGRNTAEILKYSGSHSGDHCCAEAGAFLSLCISLEGYSENITDNAAPEITLCPTSIHNNLFYRAKFADNIMNGAKMKSHAFHDRPHHICLTGTLAQIQEGTSGKWIPKR